MPRNRFVAAETVRLDLSDGDWIEIKSGLTWRERQVVSGAMLRSVAGERGESTVGIDMARHSMFKLRAWLVDWSFRDAKDKPVPLNDRSIENLDEETGLEIEAAVDAYDAEQKAKKGSGGQPPPPPPEEPPTSSPSPTTNGATVSVPPRPPSV